jgi:hypothetical protein
MSVREMEGGRVTGEKERWRERERDRERCRMIACEKYLGYTDQLDGVLVRVEKAGIRV